MTISEAAARTDLTAVTLRYYERVGLIPSIKRKNGGVRDYSEEDIEWIEFIKCMRSAGLSVESLIEYTYLYQQGTETQTARKQLLIEEREQLVLKYQELGRTLEQLNKKIAYYDKI